MPNPQPLQPSEGGYFSTCDFRYFDYLVEGGTIIMDPVQAQRLWEAGCPMIPYNQDGYGDPEIDFLLAGYRAMKLADPSVQFMPFLAPLIKNGFDQVFKVIGTRVGYFNGVGPWNPQLQYGANSIYEDPASTPVLILPTLNIDPATFYDQLGARVTLMRQLNQATSVTVHSNVEQIGIGWPNNPLAIDFDMTLYASVELCLSLAPVGPGPVAYWHVTSVVPF